MSSVGLETVTFGSDMTPNTNAMSTPDLMSLTDGPLYNISELLHPVTQNHTLRDDCYKIIFSELEFLPWDNPDNLVSTEVETIIRQFKNCLVVLLLLIGGPANAISMAVFYKQGLKDRVNLCLFALSLTDELYLMALVLHHGEQLYIQFTTQARFGPVTIFMTNRNLTTVVFLGYVSPVLSAIIATERCLCVYNPLKFQRLLRTRTMAVVIVAVYLLLFVLFFIVCFRYRTGCVYDPTTGVEEITAVEGEFYQAHKDFIDHLDSFVFGVGLHGTEVIVVMTTTVMTIVKLRQIVKWRSDMSSTISLREVALTKMLVGSSILFIACIFPNAVIRFSWLFLPEVNSGRRHQNFFLCCLWFTEVFSSINATFNFFVYYVMGSRYRETFWALFGRKMQTLKA